MDSNERDEIICRLAAMLTKGDIIDHRFTIALEGTMAEVKNLLARMVAGNEGKGQQLS